jgi:hypothetical protein
MNTLHWPRALSTPLRALQPSRQDEMVRCWSEQSERDLRPWAATNLRPVARADDGPD